jgi:hypothetical protein
MAAPGDTFLFVRCYDDADESAQVWAFTSPPSSGTGANGDLAVVVNGALSKLQQKVGGAWVDLGLSYQSWRFFGNWTDASKQYLGATDAVELASPNLSALIVAPCDGEVVAAIVHCENASGSTVCSLYKNSADVTTDTQTLNATTSTQFSFSSSNTFSKGDRIGIAIDPTTAGSPGRITAQVIVRLDWTTL